MYIYVLLSHFAVQQKLTNYTSIKKKKRLEANLVFKRNMLLVV